MPKPQDSRKELAKTNEFKTPKRARMFAPKTEVVTTDTEVAVTRFCPMCNSGRTVIYERKAFDNWAAGMKIQDAMPTVTLDDREHLISGICSDCWKKL